MHGFPLKTAYSGDARIHLPNALADRLSKWAQEAVAHRNANDDEGSDESNPSDHPSETTEDEDS